MSNTLTFILGVGNLTLVWREACKLGSYSGGLLIIILVMSYLKTVR